MADSFEEHPAQLGASCTISWPMGAASALFNAIDDYNRESLGIKVGFSLPTARVIRALDADHRMVGGFPRPFDATTARNTSAGRSLPGLESESSASNIFSRGQGAAKHPHRALQPHRALRVARALSVRYNSGGAGVRHPMAMDI